MFYQGEPGPTVTANNALKAHNAAFTPIIILEPNQTYSVEYSVYGSAPEGSGLNAALRFL